jgi:hypothetical protein
MHVPCTSWNATGLTQFQLQPKDHHGHLQAQVPGHQLMGRQAWWLQCTKPQPLSLLCPSKVNPLRNTSVTMAVICIKPYLLVHLAKLCKVYKKPLQANLSQLWQTLFSWQGIMSTDVEFETTYCSSPDSLESSLFIRNAEGKLCGNGAQAQQTYWSL